MIEPHFERIFGDKAMLHEWFNQVIQFAEALTLAGDYRNFGEVARAALEMTAEAHRVRLSPEDAREIMRSMPNLSAYAEVPKALSRLKSAGFRMVTLTKVSQLPMVAAHAWDVGGAMRAGCGAAFIARPGKAVFSLFPRPDIAGNDLAKVAEAILKAELPQFG